MEPYTISKIIQSAETFFDLSLGKIDLTCETLKDDVNGNYDPNNNDINVRRFLEWNHSMSVFLHELGHCFYYSLYPNCKTIPSTIKFHEKSYDDNDIFRNHEERMADVLGWKILLRVKDCHELKDYYLNTFLERKI